MRKYFLHIALASLALCPAVAMADVLSYSFIQLTGNVATHINPSVGSSVKGSGPGFAFGWIMGPYLFTDASYDKIDFSHSSDITQGNVRLGIRNRFRTISPWKLDGYATVSYEYLKLNGGGDTNNGLGLSVGLRASPVETFEFFGEAGYKDYSGYWAGDAKLGVQWNITPWFAANLADQFTHYRGDGPHLDRNNVILGLRFQFGGG